MADNTTAPKDPAKLAEWIAQQEKAKAEQDAIKKAEDKKKSDADKKKRAEALKAGYDVTEIVEGGIRGLGKAVDKVKYESKKSTLVSKLNAVEEDYNQAKRNYEKNPTLSNAKKYLSNLKDYKKLNQDWVDLTGGPWKKGLSFPDEASLSLPSDKKTETKPKGESAGSGFSVEQVPQVAAQMAETAREDRRAKVAATVNPLASTVDPNDPKITTLMKTGMTRDQAIAALATLAPAVTPGNGTGSGSSTQSSYKIFNEQETATFANQIAQNLLGRELTSDEIARATQTINVQSKANPNVARQSGSSVVQSGGISEQQIIKEELQMAPEYANYQQATTYFDAMLGSLRGTAGGGI